MPDNQNTRKKYGISTDFICYLNSTTSLQESGIKQQSVKDWQKTYFFRWKINVQQYSLPIIYP